MANLRVNKITGTEVFETTGSVQFDGSGDYLSLADSADFDFGSGDFTVEGWIYLIGNGESFIFGQSNNLGADATCAATVLVSSTNSLVCRFFSGSTVYEITHSILQKSVWNHFALVRNGSSGILYLNGVAGTSVSLGSIALNNSSNQMSIGRLGEFNQRYFNGHISNFRILKGTALYTKNFTPPTRELTVIPNTVLLCCQSTTRANEERTGKTITVNGNAVANELTPGLLTDRIRSGGSSAISGSVEFDGTGDYLSIPDSDDFNVRTGDFTLECWVNSSNNSNYQGIFGSYDYDNAMVLFQISNTGVLRFVNPSAIDVSGTTNLWDGGWHHIVMCRSGSTLRGFVDGKQEISTSYSSSIDWGHSNNSIVIGIVDRTDYPGQYEYKGFISNLRVIKGTALYTQNFIPPTRELKNLPGTVLLCCQNSKSATQEATGKTITVNGNATARYFTPPVGFDGFVNFDGATKIKTPNYFYLPTGTTEDRGRGRGVFGGGTASPGSSNLNSIEYITIQTLGNATDFGDLTVATRTKQGGGVASYTRGITGGGFDSGNTNRIEYITFATTGNAINFGGTLTTAGRNLASASNSVRGIFAGGDNRATVIDYLTIASTGTVSSFGSLPSPGRSNLSGCASQTRALFGGGYATPAVLNTIEYATIASTGSVIDFGDLTVARFDPGACSNSIRSIFAGGGTPTPTLFNIIDYITIASTGNATDFGDLIVVEQGPAGTSSQTRGVFAGGQSAYVNTIQYITITSTGNAQDFGDLIVSRSQAFSCSDSHGGLG